MRRSTSFAVASLAIAAAFSAAPVANAAGDATHSGTAQAASYSCSGGYFCIYSGWDGHGTRCQWAQPSLANTADNCSFIRAGKPVKSVWNNTNHRVQYYKKTNYNGRVGSTTAHKGGNLMGSYQIRSFKPQ